MTVDIVRPAGLRHSRPLRVLAVVALVGCGVAVGLLLARLGAGPAGPTAAAPVTVDRAAAPADGDALAALPEPGPLVAASEAGSAEQAVAGYLTAEARGEFAASYEFLSAADRASYPSVAAWVGAHADLPPITAFAMEQPGGAEQAGVAQATVTTLTGYEPGLDPVLGLITSRGRATWTVVDEGGVWRVALADSAVEPLYPPDAGAADVARAWADARVACAPTAELESGLLGVPALAAELCERGGAAEVGEVSSLTTTTPATALVSAYGPEVTEWARVVPVHAPVPQQLVLAPLGARWRVIGVLPASP